MRVAFLGFISAIEEYKDRKTGEVKRSVSVASTNQMMKIPIGFDDQYEEMDSVLVAGDLKVFDRNYYVENPIIRLSTSEDRDFLKGLPVKQSEGAVAQVLRGGLPKVLPEQREKVGG